MTQEEELAQIHAELLRLARRVAALQKVPSDEQALFLMRLAGSDDQLSTRARRALGNRTWADVVCMYSYELLKIRNLGRLTLTEIENRLSLEGLSLRGSEP